ncbi:unnamed protein product [Eruca vesicaria subsp. sativa]|uniref:Zinc finger PHD-type domain-containing protein n=1 Tax=Eruca vesicaria subsp. sativa TaxID=29727 RepID=A0ABC8KHR0_ERUVS|nr:unnamed protein product [Eruca vesicaria subsp. sativa]
MVSVNLSSSPSTPPPTFILCPSEHLHYIYGLTNEPIHNKSSKPHHLIPLDLSRINVDVERRPLRCHTCMRYSSVCDYWCETCCVPYHKECLEPPPKINVLYHPKHPLRLHCSGWGKLIKCSCCGERPVSGILYYNCRKCDFNLHTVCAIKQNILSINYPKRHEHTLIYFPRRNSLVCDVCALDDKDCFVYICYQCDFVVHKTCIYLPTTIRISRHEHRLSFTPNIYIPEEDWSIYHDEDWSCGVCRKIVDGNYGQYSCVKGCDYFVHSKCATLRNLWDGEEHEGEPEIEYEDIKTFKEIGDGRVIQHFSHPKHHMKLKKESDEGKWCQACILPIYEGNIYECMMKCDFILHETCAHLPRRKWHPLHVHPLTLQVNHIEGGTFICHACMDHCCGFAYECCEPRCSFTIDVRCALVYEPFIDHCIHPHPLFLSPKEGTKQCSLCYRKPNHSMTCNKCSFSFGLCFRCATIPNKMKYISDEHVLTRSYYHRDNIISDIYCEICEQYSYYDVGYYMCNVCCTAVHITCLLGNHPFIKHGESIIIEKTVSLDTFAPSVKNVPLTE